LHIPLVFLGHDDIFTSGIDGGLNGGARGFQHGGGIAQSLGGPAHGFERVQNGLVAEIVPGRVELEGPPAQVERLLPNNAPEECRVPKKNREGDSRETE